MITEGDVRCLWVRCIWKHCVHMFTRAVISKALLPVLPLIIQSTVFRWFSALKSSALGSSVIESWTTMSVNYCRMIVMTLIMERWAPCPQHPLNMTTLIYHRITSGSHWSAKAKSKTGRLTDTRQDWFSAELKCCLLKSCARITSLKI